MLRTLLIAHVVVWFAASTAVAQPALPSGISEDELFGTMVRNAKWAKMPIPVCWENPAPSNDNGRQLAQQAVHETWET